MTTSTSPTPFGARQLELLGFLLDLALEASAASGAALFVPLGEVLRVLLSRGVNGPGPESTIPVEGTLAGDCYARGRLVTGTEQPHEGGQGSLWGPDGSVDTLAAPVLRQGQTVAVLVLHRRHPGHFRRPDTANAVRIAELIAGIWTTAPEAEVERRASLEVRAAARLALVASSQLTEPELWQEIAQTAGALLETEAVRVSVLEGTELVCRGAAGQFRPDLGLRQLADAGIEGRALERVDGVLVSAATSEVDTAGGAEWIGSVLAVPIRRVEAVVGTITVADPAPDRFTESDRAALLRFGLQSAAAVAEARLHHGEARRQEENRLAASVAFALAAAQDATHLRRTILERLRVALRANGARLSERLQHQWVVTGTDGAAPLIEAPPQPGRQLLCGHVLPDDEVTHRCALPDHESFLLAAELGHGEQNRGAIQLLRREAPFDSLDEQSLRRLADIAAVALVTRISDIRLSQHADRIRSVAEVSATLHQALTVRDALRQGAAILQRALGAESLSIALVEEARGEIAFPVHRVGAETLDGYRRPFGRGFIEEVWRSGVTMFFPAAASEELDRLGLTAAVAARTLAGVPIRCRGAVTGVIAIEDSRRDHAFDPEDVKILEIVAQQLGVTLENIEVLEEERRQRITADWLRHMARSATDRATTPMQLLEMAADAAFQGVTGVAAMMSVLVGDGSQRLLGVRGLRPPAQAEPRAVEGTIVGWVLREHGGTFVSSDISTDERLRPEGRAQLPDAYSLIGVPVWGEGRIVGVLMLAREAHRGFSALESERLAQIADHAGAGFQTARSTEALRQSEERYRNLISTATDAIFTLDADGKVTSFNEAAERLWRVPAAEALGEWWEIVLLFDPSEHVSEQIRLAMAGHSRFFESEVRRRDGDRRTVAVSISPLVESRQTTAVLGIVRDVTDQHRLYAQLLQAEKMSAIGQLVGGMAHEINNPLASIGINLELLLGEVRDPGQLEALQAIKSEADRAGGIVRNLLTYVRGQGSERAIVDLRETIRSAVALRRYQLLSQHIEISIEVPEEPLRVWGNKVNLQQVLINLIVNAEHAIRHAGGSGHIWIKGAPSGGLVFITVDDDGPGVPTDMLTRIFDPFFTTKPEGEGTGLGLSVSAGIVAEHEGRIYAEARPHSGMRFVIELPARATATAAPEPARESGAAVSDSPRGKRVLLIDDEPDIRRSISKFLSRSGWEVLLADSGEEGLRLIEVGDFDAVLCDLRMPGMSGHEFYRRMVASGSAMVDRLVFMTGDVTSPEAQNFLSAAGRPALSKPFTLPELVAALSRVTAS